MVVAIRGCCTYRFLFVLIDILSVSVLLLLVVLVFWDAGPLLLLLSTLTSLDIFVENYQYCRVDEKGLLTAVAILQKIITQR